MQQRKVATSFSLELSQLERIERITKRFRINRSEFGRGAFERELQRYERELERAPETDGHLAIADGPVVEAVGVGRKTNRRR